MSEWILLAAVIVAAVVALALVLMYNTLVTLRARVNNSWAQIDVQLKRRVDLIPNLVEAVKGYMRHERTVLENITKARTAVLGAKGPREAAAAENLLAGALKTLFAVAENYPALRASENFKSLQEQLAETESKIAYTRHFYNDAVMSYNATIQSIPWNLIAGPLGFTLKEYFQAEAEARAPVKISF